MKSFAPSESVVRSQTAINSGNGPILVIAPNNTTDQDDRLHPRSPQPE